MKSITLILTAALFLVACGSSGSSGSAPVDNVAATPVGGSGIGAGGDEWAFIEELPYDYPTDSETQAVTFMREEEKLARDVYLYLYDLWGQNIFSNIADSEQQHTDATLRLLEKYDLVDPAEGKLEGEFTDAILLGLYDMLVAQGTGSQVDALIVGATIEDLDIHDLQRLLTDIDNEDITQVFENLMRGSRNHLRSFHARLVDAGFTYTPQYISQEEYDAIVNSPRETGQ